METPSDPVHAAPSPAPPEPVVEGRGLTSPVHILFIDNDPDLRALAFDALGRMFPGLTFAGVNDTEGLERVLHEGAFDLVVTDYILDWTDGEAILARIKRSYPDCPVIIFTVTGEDRAVLKALQSGSSDDPAHRWPQFFSLLSVAVRAGIEKVELVRGRRRAVEALSASESRFRSVFETASDAIVITDSNGMIFGWNGAARRFFGYDETDAIGKPLSMLMPKRYRGRRDAGLRRYKDKGISSVPGRTVEIRGLRKDGTEFPIELSVGAWESEEGGGFSGVMRDVTDRKRAEHALRQSYEQLQTLTARIARIQEEERIAIAREIHDELGQSLTALRLDIAWLAKRLTAGRKDIPSEQKRLDEMARRIESMVAQVRRISAELRPGVLDELGLAAAIESQAEDFSARTGIPCAVRLDIQDKGLDRNVTTAVFRVFQECLTNVARHARASRVDVGLSQRNGGLELRVRDDGRGISASELRDPHSLGLLGMIERCRSIGGDVEIAGSAGQGTTVTVTAPLLVERCTEAAP